MKNRSILNQLKKPDSANIDPKQMKRGSYCHRHDICAASNRLDPDQVVCLICNKFLPLISGVDPLAQARVMGQDVDYKTIRLALAFEANAQRPECAGGTHLREIPSCFYVRRRVDYQTEMTRAPIAGHSDPPVPASMPAPVKPELKPDPASEPASAPKLKQKPEPTPEPKRRGRKPTPGRPEPGPGEKRCNRLKCKNPILPATNNYFYRNATTPDKLQPHCIACQKEAQKAWYLKKRQEKISKAAAKKVAQ